ncbi:hypothetical protein [Nocardioides ganghwensis]|uniref:Uncharacterized protein n=1 Tax=Nocardioides ganghwensis TaxID=252230 RepID=A0A4Q2S734_9ACTN|nr:hypothetical protein [Nocardioides ganghwensis]MBD3947991.1 hypothetical protein [Nocardioides ganghwensis]RYB97433.1 hypothetical protein EUA07_20150 [Nocardioides ganghwensis]
MNDDLDLMRRVVDYHDHIAAPPVLVADDLQRGRRRVRRRRGLLAGGAALGLASVVAAVSLLTAGGPDGSPQPVGPPMPTSTFEPVPGNPGLDGPLVAPQSILDVEELGFRVEGLPALSGTLKTDRQEIEVAVASSTFAVEVYYQGEGLGLTATDQPRQEVSINGVPGTVVERFDGNSHLTYLVWEYAPDSWASVWRSDDAYTPSRKAQILTIAEAIRPGGAAVRVPFRLGTASAPLLAAETVSQVSLPRDNDFWHVSFEGGLVVGGRSPARSSCDPSAVSSIVVQDFTYRGYTGCLLGTGEDRSQVSAIVLEVDGTERLVHRQDSPLTGDEIEDLKPVLADLTVATSDDTATWFDLRTALGG